MRVRSRSQAVRHTWVSVKKTLAIAMILQQFSPPLGRATPPPLNQTGRWVATSSLGFSGTHVALLRVPGSDTAKVFLFGEAGGAQTMKFWRFIPGDTNLITPLTSSSRSSLLGLPHPNNKEADLFCSGHATLPDGRMVLVGGSWLPTETCEDTYTLDPASSAMATPWTRNAEMAVQRWYATATPLSDGKVLASAGNSSSGMMGFGGLAEGVTVAETTSRVLRPLELSARFSWGDTILAPADSCTITCNRPARYDALTPFDNYTGGRFPPGREGMAFVADSKGRAIVYGGRRKLSDGSFGLLNDAWMIGNSKLPDDSTHGCHLLEQVGDTLVSENGGLPVVRWGCAATWAGTESGLGAKESEATGAPICYVHGGKDASGNLLGDLWRGERRQNGTHYTWQWKRLLAGDASTARFGHAMMFDPGVPNSIGAPRAKLLIYGGLTNGGTLADNTRIYLFGVGESSNQKGVWRSLQPSGTAPAARMWQAMTPKYRVANDTEREYFLFGGETATGTPVAAELWALNRPDLNPGSGNDEEAYAWEQLTTTGTGPSARSRASMGYAVDGQLLVVFGGDTNGSQTTGGLSNQLFRLQAIYGGSWEWSTPPGRNFHGVPPGTAGMGLVALGESLAKITRTMESFTGAGTSSPSDCSTSVMGQWETTTTPTPESERPIADYPNIYQLPDGRLFNAGPATGFDLAATKYKRFFNLSSRAWEETSSGDNQDAFYFGSSVMYRPGRILRAGSVSHAGNGKTETIDIGAGQQPAWVAYPDTVNGTADPTHPAVRVRTHANLTILPTGDVLATGGVKDDDNVNNSPLNKAPQLWLVNAGRWTDPRTDGSEFLAEDPQIRNYHSTALLLPDARVLTAGGELPSPDQTTSSIFEPPYLFRSTDYAARPHVQLAPSALSPGTDFTISLSTPTNAATIKSVALMRPGSVTHAFNQGQRFVPLEYKIAQDPSRILVKAPASAYLASPGDHMIFVIDSVATDAPRVPSVAYWTRVGGTTSQPDPADVTPPAGGSFSNVREVECGGANAVVVGWTAPADDDTLSFTGTANTYNLRYTPNTGASSNFNAWTAQSTGSPQVVMSAESATIGGLSANTWYRFAVKGVGDNADTSVISNTLVAKPTECGGGGGGYHEGDGGVVAGQANLAVAADEGLAVQALTGAENSLFPGAALDASTSDVLQFPGEPRLVDGARSVYVREGSSRGLSLDRARLLCVDHAFGTECAAASGGTILAGSRMPAVVVRDRADADVTGQATGLSAEPVYADSGEVLTVTLPAADSTGDYLLVETSQGNGGAGGVRVETSAGSPALLATLHPRSRACTAAVPLAGQTTVRLRFATACAVHWVGRLVGLQAAIVANSKLVSATAAGADWTDEAGALDAHDVVIPAGDTLQLRFEESEFAVGLRRDWFLALDGTPVSALTATFLASRTSAELPVATPVRFALHQNVPNPFHDATRIGFDLPTAADVSLEVFDAQGRLVRRFASHEAAGRHAVDWDLRDSRGRKTAPGIYTYRLRAGTFEARRKLVLLP